MEKGVRYPSIPQSKNEPQILVKHEVSNSLVKDAP